MNIANLHTIIDKYEENLGLIYNEEHDELFKWRAVAHFKKVWNSPENENLSFAERFNKAKKECSVLIDNSRVSPSNGIVKLAEIDEQEVSRLFFDVLLADDSGDIVKRQNNMEQFLEEIENLRIKHFPQCWKYKQDRHAVSCYLSFFAPDDNFIYHYTQVEDFAKHIEYGFDIGSGENFRLDFYYNMCNEVIEVLKTHDSLLSKQKKLIQEDIYYNDEALHLLVFNIIWCSNVYGFYNGITCKSKKESIKEYTLSQLREKEAQERQSKIDDILEQIRNFEALVEPYKEISLVGVQVTDKLTGAIGVIVEQEVNKIKVEFASGIKVYIINKKYFARPRFEDDEEIVNAFTEYDVLKEKIEVLKRKLYTL